MEEILLIKVSVKFLFLFSLVSGSVENTYHLDQRPGLEVKKLFHTAQLSMKFIMLINVKMPTIYSLGMIKIAYESKTGIIFLAF